VITRLRASNWKAYATLDLPFRGGATFVVARNGVGKTSLVQALAFALFGEAGLGYSADQACRLGTTDTWVEVDLRLPDNRIVRVRRTITPGKPGRSRISVAGELDGVSLGEQRVDALLSEAFGMAASQLPMLTLFTEGSALRSAEQPGDFDLVRHLRSILGVDRAEEAAEQLTKYATRERRSADGVRRDQGQAGQLADLERRKRELEQLREERLAAFKATEAVLATARERLGRATEWQQHREKTSAWAHMRPRLLDDLLKARLLIPWTDEVAAGGGDSHNSLSVELFRRDAADVLVALAALRSSLAEQRAAASALLERLERTEREARGSDAVCPVCRRPMSEDDVAHAVAEMDAEGTELRAQIAETEARLRRCDGAKAAIDLVLEETPSEWRAPEVPDPGTDLATASIAVEEQSRAVDEIRVDGLRIRADLAEVQRQIDELASVSKANALATEGYKRAALAEMSAKTLRSVSAAVCARQVDPLARELGKRWENMWPAGTGLTLHPDGSLALRALGESVSYEHFSGGERTFASVMLRMLSLQALSRARFMVLDEPLEHLDARNRRVLAKLFVSAGTSGALDQVIVTTYEESLARALNSRLLSDGQVEVVYVTTADAVTP
jgi:DNA repair exonuclease SbcCD ATPase subunit